MGIAMGVYHQKIEKKTREHRIFFNRRFLKKCRYNSRWFFVRIDVFMTKYGDEKSDF